MYKQIPMFNIGASVRVGKLVGEVADFGTQEPFMALITEYGLSALKDFCLCDMSMNATLYTEGSTKPYLRKFIGAQSSNTLEGDTFNADNTDDVIIYPSGAATQIVNTTTDPAKVIVDYSQNIFFTTMYVGDVSNNDKPTANLLSASTNYLTVNTPHESELNTERKITVLKHTRHLEMAPISGSSTSNALFFTHDNSPNYVFGKANSPLMEFDDGDIPVVEIVLEQHCYYDEWDVDDVEIDGIASGGLLKFNHEHYYQNTDYFSTIDTDGTTIPQLLPSYFERCEVSKEGDSDTADVQILQYMYGEPYSDVYIVDNDHTRRFFAPGTRGQLVKFPADMNIGMSTDYPPEMPIAPHPQFSAFVGWEGFSGAPVDIVEATGYEVNIINMNNGALDDVSSALKLRIYTQGIRNMYYYGEQQYSKAPDNWGDSEEFPVPDHVENLSHTVPTLNKKLTLVFQNSEHNVNDSMLLENVGEIDIGLIDNVYMCRQLGDRTYYVCNNDIGRFYELGLGSFLDVQGDILDLVSYEDDQLIVITTTKVYLYRRNGEYLSLYSARTYALFYGYDSGLPAPSTPATYVKVSKIYDEPAFAMIVSGSNTILKVSYTADSILATGYLDLTNSPVDMYSSASKDRLVVKLIDGSIRLIDNVFTGSPVNVEVQDTVPNVDHSGGLSKSLIIIDSNKIISSELGRYKLFVFRDYDDIEMVDEYISGDTEIHEIVKLHSFSFISLYNKGLYDIYNGIFEESNIDVLNSISAPILDASNNINRMVLIDNNGDLKKFIYYKYYIRSTDCSPSYVNPTYQQDRSGASAYVDDESRISVISITEGVANNVLYKAVLHDPVDTFGKYINDIRINSKWGRIIYE
jgi:hypothetical protein